MKTRKIKIKTDYGAVSGLLDVPTKPVAAMTLAHGAGAGMHHAFLIDLTRALNARGIAVLRFQFPYMEAGTKRVDRPNVATSVVSAAVQTLRRRLPRVPVFAAGKSFGARMTTTAAARGLLNGVKGVVCFGFPLHPAGAPDVTRAKHLADVKPPTLFLQGTRDALADLKRMKKVCSKLPRATLKIVEGADHGFAVLKRSGRTAGDVFEELAAEAGAFVNSALR